MVTPPLEEAPMPAPQPITPEDIEHRFTNHPPVDPGVVEALDSVTELMIIAGSDLARLLPPGREASLAITNLEQASMWAKAAIARAQASS
jgi:hypothetical protein